MKNQDFAMTTTKLGPISQKNDLDLNTRDELSKSNRQKHSPFRSALGLASVGVLCSALVACQPKKGTDQVKIGPTGPAAGTGELLSPSMKCLNKSLE